MKAYPNARPTATPKYRRLQVCRSAALKTRGPCNIR